MNIKEYYKIPSLMSVTRNILAAMAAFAILIKIMEYVEKKIFPPNILLF